MASEEKKKSRAHIGPGGMNCACCGPAPGKERKAFFRTVKRGLKQVWRRRIQEMNLDRSMD